jgi:hypothetical protein
MLLGSVIADSSTRAEDDAQFRVASQSRINALRGAQK